MEAAHALIDASNTHKALNGKGTLSKVIREMVPYIEGEQQQRIHEFIASFIEDEQISTSVRPDWFQGVVDGGGKIDPEGDG